VINQCDGSERKCIARAQRMFLKKFQLRLFGTLPFGDRLKRVDVPSDILSDLNDRIILKSRT
jgi:hypothetical protein